MDQTSNFSSDTSNSQAWTTNERVPEIYRAQELTHLGLGALGETGLPPISCVLFNSLASRQGRGRGGGVDLRLRRARTFSSISWDIWSAPVFPAHFVEQAACVPRPGRSRLNSASGRWVRFVAARWRRSPGSRAAPPPPPPPLLPLVHRASAGAGIGERIWVSPFLAGARSARWSSGAGGVAVAESAARYAGGKLLEAQFLLRS